MPVTRVVMVGWTTKIVALTDALGRLVRFVVLPGQSLRYGRRRTAGQEVEFPGLTADNAYDCTWIVLLVLSPAGYLRIILLVLSPAGYLRIILLVLSPAGYLRTVTNGSSAVPRSSSRKGQNEDGPLRSTRRCTDGATSSRPSFAISKSSNASPHAARRLTAATAQRSMRQHL